MPNATTTSFLLSMPMKSTLRTGGVKPEFSSGIGNTGSYIIKQMTDSTEATDTWTAVVDGLELYENGNSTL